MSNSNDIKLKILLIGPCKCGKTKIANFLVGLGQADLAEYTPSVGVRIVEFEREVQVGNQRSSFQSGRKVQVELWDCSGDRKYEAGWPSLLFETHGIVIAFNPENRNADRELENWHSRFIASAGIKEQHCLIFAHNSTGQPSQTKFNKKLSKNLSRIPMINTSLDFDADTIKYEFDNLIAAITKDLAESRNSEELSIINNS